MKRNTPWGFAQHESPIIDGITSVGTSSHGGLYVEPWLNTAIPEYMRRRDGWYEEDCDWCIPFVALEAEIIANGTEAAKRAIESGEHKNTLRNWHPDAYEWFFDEILTGRTSFKRAEREFAHNMATTWVVYSACTDSSWQPVPEGMVRCSAGQGLRGNGLPIPTRTFLVPEAEYSNRGQFGFVIEDTAKYQEVA